MFKYFQIESSEKRNTDDNNEKEIIPFPKLTGIITQARKPSVRFSISDDEPDGTTSFESDEKSIRRSSEKLIRPASKNLIRPSSENLIRPVSEKLIRPASEKQRFTGTQSETSYRPFVIRSLSEACIRENVEDKMLLRRQKSAVVTFKTKADYIIGSKTQDDIALSPRSDSFFVKSKAAYQLRQDLKRQAILRKQGVSQKPVTLSDYLDAERDRYIESSGKIREYIKRIDTEKMFRPLMINKWTAADIEKQL